jgi:dipeptidase E
MGISVKFLLTSSGISNTCIRDSLVELLDKPISESNALFVPTGMYPFPGGGTGALNAIRGTAKSPLSELGWKSLSVLELTALPSIQRKSWVPTVQEADALLVWGGNVLYLCHWMRESGLAELFPTLENLVYVGVSAGSIAMSLYNCDAEFNLQFVPAGSDMAVDVERGLGLVNFAMTVHLDHPDPMFEDNSSENVEKWAASIPVPTYAIDDQSAIKVTGSDVEVISEGNWRLFTPSTVQGTEQ